MIPYKIELILCVLDVVSKDLQVGYITERLSNFLKFTGMKFEAGRYLVLQSAEGLETFTHSTAGFQVQHKY